MKCLLNVPRALLAAVLSLSVLASAQEPTVDTKQLRREADAAVQAKDYDAAAAAFKKLTEADPKDSRSWHMLGYSLHVTGHLDDALAAHMKAATFPQSAPASTYNVACVYAMKGKPDEAFQWLDKAIAVGFADAELLGTDTDLDSLRKDPRFEKAAASLKAKAKPAKMQVYEQNIDRKNARAAWFGGKGSPAQISVDYTPVPWNADYETKLASGEYKGQKWRLGSDFWTRLDTWVELRFGDVVVPAGYYYMTLEQRDANTFVLALHDPAAVRKQKLDGYQAAQLKGGIEIVMAHATSEDVQKTLDISVLIDKGSTTKGNLGVHFGGHSLTAPFVATIE